MAVFVSLGGATLLHLPEPYWAVITSFVIMQGSLGGTVRASLERLAGTVCGALLGGASGWVVERYGGSGMWAFVCLVPVLSLVSVKWQGFRLAPITAAIVMLAAPPGHSPLVVAAARTLEIAFGCVVGIGVSHFIFPDRARTLMAETGRALLRCLAELAGAYLSGASSDAIDQLGDKARALMVRLSAAADAEASERRVRLLHGPQAFPLVRSLRRLRYDVAVLARAVAVDPAPEGPALANGVAQTLRGAAAMFEGAPAPTLDALDAAIAAVAPTGPLSFALATMRRDMEDLLGRIIDAEGVRVDPT